MKAKISRVKKWLISTINQEKHFRRWRAGFELRAGLLHWNSLFRKIPRIELPRKRGPFSRMKSRLSFFVLSIIKRPPIFYFATGNFECLESCMSYLGESKMNSWWNSIVKYNSYEQQFIFKINYFRKITTLHFLFYFLLCLISVSYCKSL